MLQFNESSKGNEFELNVGENFEIILHENPTTGFRWSLISNGEPACKLLRHSFETGNSSSGNGGSHCWQFQGVQVGIGKIDLVYQRSWEREGTPTQSFTLNVRVV